ncbi:DUF692 domain-containing protein [Dyadobacter sp. CY345]|uniref:DUF692 domain-containing protein n=1 Tax=Dyadobacter sp. CY345 TaxID=2909335 RepID=UPI001F37CDEF|nr:DUF692 family multinuclear iron-containing protein [Dyadobacter sp. CY345]MCF2445203.1 DUF692 domain-containing protein [Dyadobacter sp. CY345]
MKPIKIGTTYEGGRPDFLEKLLSVVDYLEFSPDSLATSRKGVASINPEKLEELKKVDDKIDLLVHGVGLSIGSYDGVSKNYLNLLDELLENLCLKWHSEHLAYIFVDGVNLGTMVTLPRTIETLAMVCDRINKIQDRYNIPFLLENVVSLIPEYHSNYSHADFLNKICERTGCGLILDIYNLECDAFNHGLNIELFLNELNCNHIKEFHIASGFMDSGFMTDIHAGLTSDTTLELTQHVIERYQPENLEAITYELLDEFVDRVGQEAILNELEKLKVLFYEKSPATC